MRRTDFTSCGPIRRSSTLESPGPAREACSRAARCGRRVSARSAQSICLVCLLSSLFSLRTRISRRSLRSLLEMLVPGHFYSLAALARRNAISPPRARPSRRRRARRRAPPLARQCRAEAPDLLSGPKLVKDRGNNGISTSERSERGEMPRNEHFDERALASDENCEPVSCILRGPFLSKSWGPVSWGIP